MLQLKFFGVGGQGVVTAAKMLSKAVSLYEDEYAITVPAYGHERRGAPVNTSIIVDKEPVLLNSFVYEPDVVLVLDHTIIDKGINIAEGIHQDSILILNSEDPNVLARYREYGFKNIYYADGTGAALEAIGKGIPNSSMLGAVAAAGIVKLSSVEGAIMESFGEKAGEGNAEAARNTYARTKKI